MQNCKEKGPNELFEYMYKVRFLNLNIKLLVHNLAIFIYFRDI